MEKLTHIVNLEQYPLSDDKFRSQCKNTLDQDGVLMMSDFLIPPAVLALQKEGINNQHLAFYTANNHNVYLASPDPAYPQEHPRNREVTSSKGCITTDQIPSDSILRVLYDSPVFRAFLCTVLDETALHEYADSLSSLNIHYAGEGQELGWHFDNSSFAITLMIQRPDGGGIFEYITNVRNADNGEMNYEITQKIIDGDAPTKTLMMDAGTLVLFRGRNAAHRVTPVEGNRTRMLAVLAYNTEPGISLSESARMTFFGRLG